MGAWSKRLQGGLSALCLLVPWQEKRGRSGQDAHQVALPSSTECSTFPRTDRALDPPAQAAIAQHDMMGAMLWWWLLALALEWTGFQVDLLDGYLVYSGTIGHLLAVS